MRRNRIRYRASAVLAAGVFMLGAGLCPAYALTLTGNTSSSSTPHTACPEHPGHNCWATALAVDALSTGRNAGFETAWNTALSGEWNPAGWTLQWSTEPLNTTLNVSTHQAFNYKPGDPGYTSSSAGAEMQIDWAPSADQQDLKWIQAINSNRGRGSYEWYLDVSIRRPPWDQPPVYPYSYADYRFYDKPSRDCEADQHIFWDGYLYLARIDRTAKTALIFEGVRWGYTIDCIVPEPLSVLVLATGCSLLGLIRRHSA